MKYGDKVRVRKLEGLNGKTAAPGEWIAGEYNPGKSPEVNFEIEGSVVTAPKRGDKFVVARSKRNGVEVPGWFQTSQVVEVVNSENAVTVRTENSVYEVVPL